MTFACVSSIIRARILSLFSTEHSIRANTIKELDLKMRASGLVDSTHAHETEFLLPDFSRKQRIGVCIVDSNRLRLVTTIPTALRKVMTAPEVESSRSSIDMDYTPTPEQTFVLDAVIDQLLAKALMGQTNATVLRTPDGSTFNTVCYPCYNAIGSIVGAVFFIQGPSAPSAPRPSLTITPENDDIVRRIETMRRGMVNPNSQISFLRP